MPKRAGIIFVCLILFLTGCMVYAPSGRDLSSADYGKKTSEKDCLKQLKKFGEEELKYPDSAKYRLLNDPQKGWVRIRNSGHATFGWIFTAQIDQKVDKDGERERLEYVMMYRKGSLIPITYKHTSKYGAALNYPYGFK